MEDKQIAILTLENDPHGMLVQNALRRRSGIVCHLISVDRICDQLTVSWSNCEASLGSAVILSNGGDRVRPRDLQLVWWRRSNPPQRVPSGVEDRNHVAVIRNDCNATLYGLFANEFTGRWVNDVDATRRAENKIVQLRAAKIAGFRVPRTLVSNDPSAIREFCASLQHRVVVKAVRGTSECHLFTRRLAKEHLESDESLRLSPAIYQELIPGDVHLRVHCFGRACHAVSITSDVLDWREDLSVPFDVISLHGGVETTIRSALGLLGLRMGIIDLKLTPDGNVVWLEINPQGQFLFSEALSGLDLTDELAAFLASEA